VSEASAAPDGPPAGDLAAWAGTWVGTGRGTYPTIEPFTYREELVLARTPKPFLRYESRTWAETGPQARGVPLHTETGWWRWVGAGAVELVIAIPTGHLELGVGTLRRAPEGWWRLESASTTVVSSPTAKRVDALVHRFELDPGAGALRYTLDMAAVGVGMTRHLTAELRRDG
jgi:hypothetical protein